MLKITIGGTRTPRLDQALRVLAAAVCQPMVRTNLQAWPGLVRLTRTPVQKNAPTERSTDFTCFLSSDIWPNSRVAHDSPPGCYHL
jgi:hypothetical protein